MASTMGHEHNSRLRARSRVYPPIEDAEERVRNASRRGHSLFSMGLTYLTCCKYHAIGVLVLCAIHVAFGRPEPLDDCSSGGDDAAGGTDSEGEH